MVLNVYKPSGPTSHDIVDQARKKLNVKKAGHAGTLDPFAEGVLLILTGNDTKKSNELMHQEKEYIAKIKLGFISNTCDRTGLIEICDNAKRPTRGEIEKILEKFKGEIEQIPPMFSAVKIGGKKLYELARKGIEIERKPKKIKICEIEILDYNYPILEIRIVCSSGAYIRVLADDIGKELKTGGYLESLIRTRIGDFKIEDSIMAGEKRQWHNESVREYIANSPEETKKIAEDLAKTLKGGEIFVLSGDLGAGKTTFIQGIATGLGIKENITSPTFVLMKIYKGRDNLNLVHLDCYRASSPEAILDLGLKELTQDSRNILAVEWGEKISEILPPDSIEIKFEFKEEGKRKIIILPKF